MKVRIFKPHTHAGQRYTPASADGLVIDVPAADAAFLRAQGAEDAEGKSKRLAAITPPPVADDAATPLGDR